MNSNRIILTGIVFSVLFSFQIEIFGQNDQEVIFPQWVRQSAEVWIDGGISDAEFLAMIKNVLDDDIRFHETISEEDQRYMEKMIIRGLPEIVLAGDGIPHWAKDRIHWWTEGRITDEQFLHTMLYLEELDYFGHDPTSTFTEKAHQSSLEKFLLTEKEIADITETRWRILSTEYGFEEKGVDSTRMLFTDISRVYDPIFYKFKVPSLVLQISEFNSQSDLEDYWGSFERRDGGKVFDEAYMTTNLNGTYQCFFDYKTNGAMTSCSYDNIVFHVIVFDEYGEHYDYNKNEIVLDETEPTSRFASEILNKMNAYNDTNVQLYDTMQKKIGQTHEEQAISLVHDTPKSSELERSTISGIENFSCIRDDFGLVTVSGIYNNELYEQVNLTISFFDSRGETVGRTSTALYDLEEFESKRFLGYTKWDTNFHSCQIKVE